MAEQMKPASKELAPDTATAYERAKPEKESGMGRLDNEQAVPADSPDEMINAVINKQMQRQINSEHADDERPKRPLNPGR